MRVRFLMSSLLSDQISQQYTIPVQMVDVIVTNVAKPDQANFLDVINTRRIYPVEQMILQALLNRLHDCLWHVRMTVVTTKI